MFMATCLLLSGVVLYMRMDTFVSESLEPSEHHVYLYQGQSAGLLSTKSAALEATVADGGGRSTSEHTKKKRKKKKPAAAATSGLRSAKSSPAPEPQEEAGPAKDSEVQREAVGPYTCRERMVPVDMVKDPGQNSYAQMEER